MLSQLAISNIAVIKKCEFMLSGGLNVLTGETGAGKSLIIDSLNLILGERGNRELIRHGEKKARVEALFFLCDEEKKLLEKEVGEFDGNEFIVSREIYEDGRNVCKINGEMSTVSGLREIGHALLNIHGQNDGQKLLNRANHMEFVDGYADNGDILDEYKKLYSECKEIKKKIESLHSDESEKLKRLDMIKFWLSEIDDAKLSAGEEEELSARLKIIKNSEKLKQNIMSAQNALYGGEVSVYSLLSDAVRNIQTASECDETLSEKNEILSDALYKIEDIARELSYYGDRMDFEEGELAEIEERLYLIQKLKSKYGQSEEEILEYADALRGEIEDIEFSDEKEKKFNCELEKVEEKLQKCADKLTKKRKAAADEISKGVCEELKFLDMEKVQFSVLVEKGSMTGNGQDKIEFFVSTNPAEPLKPLVNIASGGEMSRICLAIKTVLADADVVSALIFDEIDTGVSGRAAGKIGEKLKLLGDKKQVICITHLPQIAAAADSHYLIEKNFDNDTFNTDVRLLEREERICEIARIISGDSITESAKKTAEEMIGK